MRDELDELGVSADDAAEWFDDEDEENDDFYVYPENADAVRVFLALGTQWTVTDGKSGLRYHGINYLALNEIWQRLKIKKKDRDRIFDQLLVMEYAALPVRNHPQKK